MKIALLPNNTGVVTGSYHPALPGLLRSLPDARWNGVTKRWTFHATPAGCCRLLGELAAVGIAFEVDASIEDMGQRWRDEQVSRTAALENGCDVEMPLGLTTVLWRHQKRTFAFAKDSEAAMMHLAMGSGKSLATLALLVHWKAKRILIACPKAVIGVWRRETTRHAPGLFRVLCLDTGSGVQKAAQMRSALFSASSLMVVVNYETLIGAAVLKEVEKYQWDVVVAEECHRIKGAATKTSRAMYAIGRQAKRRLALSGTPMVQGPIDLYGQFRFLDAGVFGTSLSRFKDRYCVVSPAMPHVILSYKNQDELKRRFRELAITITLDDAALDLPPLTHEKMLLELEPAARKIHDELMAESVAQFGDLDAAIEAMLDGPKPNQVTAGNVLTLLLRLSQITGGFVRNDNNEVVVVSDVKQRALAELLEDIPPTEPVVVFCRFVEDLRRVRETARVCGRTYGEISGRQKDLTPQATMPDGIGVMGVQWQSGGVGIDLSRASYGVIYSPTYSGGDFEQGIARLHRPGQKRPTVFYHLICANTVDQKVYAALSRKKKLIERVTDDHDAGTQRA